VFLDSAAHVAVLLEAATDLDARSVARTSGRGPLVATLVLAGLRVGEAAELVWRDVDLAAGRLFVGRAKTAAGMREVDMLPARRAELASHKASAGAVKPTDSGIPVRGGRTARQGQHRPSRHDTRRRARRRAPRRA
jgi:integrase